MLPEKTELQEVLNPQRYDTVIVHDSPDDPPALSIPRQIRTFSTLIPVIFLADRFDADRAAKALSTGADYYLWDILGINCQNLLVPVIKNLVQHRRIEEEMAWG
jgi:DNA-binding response OmpR family regulator